MPLPDQEPIEKKLSATERSELTASSGASTGREKDAKTFAIELGTLIGRCLAEKLLDGNDENNQDVFPTEDQSAGEN